MIRKIFILIAFFMLIFLVFNPVSYAEKSKARCDGARSDRIIKYQNYHDTRRSCALTKSKGCKKTAKRAKNDLQKAKQKEKASCENRWMY